MKREPISRRAAEHVAAFNHSSSADWGRLWRPLHYPTQRNASSAYRSGPFSGREAIIAGYASQLPSGALAASRAISSGDVDGTGIMSLRRYLCCLTHVTSWCQGSTLPRTRIHLTFHGHQKYQPFARRELQRGLCSATRVSYQDISIGSRYFHTGTRVAHRASSPCDLITPRRSIGPAFGSDVARWHAMHYVRVTVR